MRALHKLDGAIHRFLIAHSIQLLRIAVGLVFLLFGMLKFFPDVSPVEELTIKTTDALSFGVIPGHVAIVLIASLECIIGLLLIAGRFLRIAIYLLAGQLIGVLAPLVLFTGRLFDGPHNAPTLEGQYAIKDIILVASGFVVASTLPGLVPGTEPARSAQQRGQPRTDWTDRS
jgi:putative oxidoreductase